MPRDRAAARPSDGPVTAGGTETRGAGGLAADPGAGGLFDTERVIDASRVGRLQLTVAVLGALVMFIDGFNTQVIGYITPQVARSWHIPNALLGPLFSSGLAGVLVGYLAVAPISSRFGHKRVMILCTALFGVLTLLTSAARTLDALILFRFLTGLGLGGAMPSANALIAEYAPQSWRSTFMVAGNCGVSLGSIVAGALSALLLHRFGWRPVLWVGGVLPLLLALLLAARLPESLEYLIRRRAGRGRIVSLLERVRPGLRVPDAARIVCGSGTSGAVGELFSAGRGFGTIAVWLGFAMNLMVYFCVQSWLPTIFVEAGHSQQIAITALTLVVAGGICAAFVIGPLMDRLHPYKVMMGFFLAAGLCVAALGLVVRAASLPLIFSVAFVTGFCILGIQKSMNAVAAHFYPTALRSVGLGWGLGVGRLGAVAGPMLAGLLLGAGWQPAALFGAAMLPMLMGAGSMAALWAVYGRAGAAPCSMLAAKA